MSDSSPAYEGRRLIIFTAIFIPVQITCVALRYFSRYLVEGAWGLDDILVMTSLALQIGMAGISLGTKLVDVPSTPQTPGLTFY